MREGEATRAHQLTLALEFGYDARRTLLDGRTEIATAGRFDIATATLDAAYRLPGDWTARLRAPFHRKVFGEGGQAVALSGPGDVELTATRDLAMGPSWVGLLGAGVALPTGGIRAQPLVGASAPTPLQLGGGTVDPILVAAVRTRLRPWLHAHAGAEARPVLYDNRYGYRSASVVGGAVGADLWPGRLVSPGLDFEYAHTSRARVAGALLPNSGRDVVYAAPRFRLRPGRRWAVDVAVRVPVFQRVNLVQFGETIQGDVRVSWVSPPLRGGDRAR